MYLVQPTLVGFYKISVNVDLMGDHRNVPALKLTIAINEMYSVPVNAWSRTTCNCCDMAYQDSKGINGSSVE